MRALSSLIAAAILASSTTAAADTVALQDGSTVEGRVLSQVPGKYVLIRTANGRELALSWDEVKRVEVTSAAEGAPEPSVSGAGAGVELGGTLEDGEAVRQAWLARGGGLAGYELKANGLFFHTTGITGYGAGAGVRLNLYSLTIRPETDTFRAFHIGAGADANGLSMSGNTSYLVTVPLQLGFRQGFGAYDGDTYRGTVLALGYQPSLTIVEGSTTFNYLGFEAGLEFLSKDQPLRLAPKAHWKVAAFVLPPLGDLPLVAALSVGMVSY